MSTFTLDASVVANALSPHEADRQVSISLLRILQDGMYPIFVPTLLFPEVSAALARNPSTYRQAVAFIKGLQQLPFFRPVTLDERLANNAAEIAIEYKLRGADSVYVAVAARYSAILVTRDKEQLQRPTNITTMTPEQVIRKLT